MDLETEIQRHIRAQAEIAPELGRRLRQARLSKGLSLPDLAQQAGTTPSILSAFEWGRILPSTETLIRLATALEVSYDALLSHRRPFALELPFSAQVAERLRDLDKLPQPEQIALLRIMDEFLAGGQRSSPAS